MTTIEFTEQELEFIKWSMEVVEDEDTWSKTSKAIAVGIINKIRKENI